MTENSKIGVSLVLKIIFLKKEEIWFIDSTYENIFTMSFDVFAKYITDRGEQPAIKNFVLNDCYNFSGLVNSSNYLEKTYFISDIDKFNWVGNLRRTEENFLLIDKALMRYVQYVKVFNSLQDVNFIVE